MPAIGKVTLDSRDYEATLAKIKKQTNSAANSMSKSIGKVGGDVSKAGGVLSAFGTAAGQSFGALGQVISAVASGPIAVLIAAIGALVAIGVSAWDKMTLSAEEYAAKLDRVAAQSDKARAKLEKQQGEDSGYMTRLQELASKERLSNESKAEAANLIKVLTARYGDLGISIDGVTGSIKGADEAQKKLLARMAQQRMDTVRRQIDSTRKKARHEGGQAVEDYVPNILGMKSVVSFFGGDVTMGGKKMLQEFMDTAPVEKQIAAFEELRDSMSTKEDMDNFQRVIDSLEKQLALEQELKNLRESGHANESERAAALRKNAENTQKREDFKSGEDFNAKYQDLINRGLHEQAERLKLINDLKRQGIKIDETQGEWSEEQIRKNIAALEEQKVKNAQPMTLWAKNENGDLQQYSVESEDQRKNADLDRKIAAWQGVLDGRRNSGLMLGSDVDDVLRQRNDLKKGSFKSGEEENLRYQQLINQGKDEEAKALKLINDLKKSGVYLTQAEAEEVIKKRREVASESYYKDSIRDLEAQIQVQQLINQGKDEEAKRQQIINELKKRGLDYDAASVDRVMELNKQLGSLNLQKSQKQEFESLYDKALRAAGRGKEADQTAALKRARESKGSDLTDAERDTTLKLLALTEKLNNLGQGPNLGDMSIKTNSLTARGGFQGGAVAPDKDRINKAISDHTKRTNELLQEISRGMKDAFTY